MVNHRSIIIHKTGHKKGRRGIDYDIYKKDHPFTPKQVVNIFDLYRIPCWRRKGFPKINIIHTEKKEEEKYRTITRRNKLQL